MLLLHVPFVVSVLFQVLVIVTDIRREQMENLGNLPMQYLHMAVSVFGVFALLVALVVLRIRLKYFRASAFSTALLPFVLSNAAAVSAIILFSIASYDIPGGAPYILSLFNTYPCLAMLIRGLVILAFLISTIIAEYTAQRNQREWGRIVPEIEKCLDEGDSCVASDKPTGRHRSLGVGYRRGNFKMQP